MTAPEIDKAYRKVLKSIPSLQRMPGVEREALVQPLLPVLRDLQADESLVRVLVQAVQETESPTKVIKLMRYYEKYMLPQNRSVTLSTLCLPPKQDSNLWKYWVQQCVTIEQRGWYRALELSNYIRSNATSVVMQELPGWQGITLETLHGGNQAAAPEIDI